MKHWFRRYLPWWIGLGFFIGYDIIAALMKRLRTLSQLAWDARRNFPALPYVVAIVIIIIYAHLFLGLWEPSHLPVPPTPAPYVTDCTSND